MSLKNWTNYHTPGDRLDVFTRSNPNGDEIKATYVEGVSPRRKKRKKRPTMRDAFDAMRRARRF